MTSCNPTERLCLCPGLDLHALQTQLGLREAESGEGGSVSSATDDTASLEEGPPWLQRLRIIARVVLDYSMLSWMFMPCLPCLPCLPEIDDANIGRVPSAQSA
jgi:hypothetical protein